jgi:hypothetical protein
LLGEAEGADIHRVWTAGLEPRHKESAARRANVNGKAGGEVANTNHRVDGVPESVAHVSANFGCGHALCVHGR